MMDKGYDSKSIRAHLIVHAMVPVIPPKSHRVETIDYDQNLYQLREKVERFFHNLKPFRRMATRYEKLGQTFLAFIHLVAAWMIIK